MSRAARSLRPCPLPGRPEIGPVIYLKGGDEKTVLDCFEEGLRHVELGAVVAEVARLPMTASRRRLQLAAEGSRSLGVALRCWRRQTEATDLRQPTAAATRWRISALPSTPLPVPGVSFRDGLANGRNSPEQAFLVGPCTDGLRQERHGSPRMTRGRCGSLPLHRRGLSPRTSCRSPGAPVHPINPAASVRGPLHRVKCGKTPVLDPSEARAGIVRPIFRVVFGCGSFRP